MPIFPHPQSGGLSTEPRAPNRVGFARDHRHLPRRALLAIVEQRIQFIDQWLHLCRIGAAHARVNAFVYGRKLVPQLVYWGHASPNLQEPEEHAEHPDRSCERTMPNERPT
jgi:hypothetical protein